MKRNTMKTMLAAATVAMMGSSLVVSASADTSVYDMTKADLEGQEDYVNNSRRLVE